ncbi:MAG TPA: hypothetical protein VGM04_07725 [Sphingomicrobium sp.]
MATVRLDRKTKTALGGLVVVIVFLLALTIRNSIVALTSESVVATATAEGTDELVQIGGHTLLLKHGSATNKVAHWVQRTSTDSRAFELGPQAFAPNSGVLTEGGEQKAGAFAQMMNHVRALNARILVSTYKANPRLAELRADRLRQDLIEDGVAASRITVSPEPIGGGRALSSEPELVLLLSS